jgi:CRP-like cAMP-binding protein
MLMKSAQVTNALTMKLEQFTCFSAADRERLDQLSSDNLHTWPAKCDVLEEGKHVETIHLVVSGLAMRNKIMPDGKRQIMAFLIPGDLCDVEVFVLGEMDHAISAVSDTTCARIPSSTMTGLLTEMQGLTRALWWSTMTDAAVLRERIIDFGQRKAPERMAHLFYEMLVRYRMIGLAKDNSYLFPVTQEELADATGLTPVHVGRTLRKLRSAGLIEFSGKILTVKDAPALKRMARFSADYLHLRQTNEDVGGVSQRVGDLV